MQRNRRNANATLYAACLLLLTITCIGCGHPMVYHFKHYHRPFAAVAESNKTYFHSSQTGRIIPKEECATYCEPGCFGYEPTTWTRWPSECPGNCPVQGEVISDVPVEEVISSGAAVSVVDPYQAHPSPEQVRPEPLDIEPGPPPQVPSIPTDIESSVPSPSDATRRLPSDMTARPEPQVVAVELKERVDAKLSASPRALIEPVVIIARNAVPAQKRTKPIHLDSSTIDPTGADLKTELALTPSKKETKPTTPEPKPRAPKEPSSLVFKSVPTTSRLKAEEVKPQGTPPTPRKETGSLAIKSAPMASDPKAEEVKPEQTLPTSRKEAGSLAIKAAPMASDPKAEEVKPEQTPPTSRKEAGSLAIKSAPMASDPKAEEVKLEQTLPTPLKEATPLAVKSASKARSRAEEGKSLKALGVQTQPTAVVTEGISGPSKPVSADSKATKKEKNVAVIKVAHPGDSSQIRFAPEPARHPNRMSAVAAEQILIRFR